MLQGKITAQLSIFSAEKRERAIRGKEGAIVNM